VTELTTINFHKCCPGSHIGPVVTPSGEDETHTHTHTHTQIHIYKFYN